MTDLSGEHLRRWRESQSWDVPRMARELRNAARDSGEDVAAHHGLVKMIPQWERGRRTPRERYLLLYLKIFQGTAGGLSPGMTAGVDVARRLAEVRSRAARLPSAGEVRALEASALGTPGTTMTAAQIRALTAETIASLHKIASNLTELSALLSDDEAGQGNEASPGGEGTS